MLVLLVAVEIVIFMWNTTLMFIGLLIAPGTIMFTICSVAIRLFREIEKEPGAVSGVSEDK
jgi:hypothetical protein